ncbi:SEC-C motif-containing protein [Lachnospiraceae bacterium A10]|nr:SEC-C motif-containing protein [Lachnospiraceae bacterium A10]
MALLEQWRSMAYNREEDQAKLQKLWNDYFAKEKEIYEILLTDPDNVVKGTVKELADHFKIDIMTMTGFLDGINDSLVESNPIETMEEDTVVSLAFDKERLYMNMVDAEADWLYGLEQWNRIFDADKQKELYRAQKSSHTIVRAKKIGRNDPCPCGSGKKYKQCCLKKDQAAEREARMAK